VDCTKGGGKNRRGRLVNKKLSDQGSTEGKGGSRKSYKETVEESVVEQKRELKLPEESLGLMGGGKKEKGCRKLKSYN